MKVYMILLFEGAITVSTRPQGAGGSPLAVLSLSAFQVLPPSSLRKKPLPLGASGPSPPERKVQPLRRKSHMPANRRSGFFGSIARLEQPVERFEPFKMSVQVLPPSVVL